MSMDGHLFLPYMVPVCLFSVESFDNLAYKRVSHDVLLSEKDGIYAFYPFGEFYAFKQTGVFLMWKVNLAGISCDNEFGVASHPGKEHFQLS